MALMVHPLVEAGEE
jgi:hypothetical protein